MLRTGWCVSLGGCSCSLFCGTPPGLLSVELSVVVFFGSCTFSQTLTLKHSQVVTSGQRLRQQGEERCPVVACGDFLSLSSTVAVSTTPAIELLGKGISDICSMVEGVTVLLFWFCWVFFVCLGFFWRGVYLLFFWLYFSLLTWSFSSNSKDLEMVLLFVTCRV